jgi:hypothetical protein
VQEVHRANARSVEAEPLTGSDKLRRDSVSLSREEVQGVHRDNTLLSVGQAQEGKRKECAGDCQSPKLKKESARSAPEAKYFKY